MCAVPNGETSTLETHPIQEKLHGNGNRLLVMSKSIMKYLQGSSKGYHEHLWLCLALHSYIMQYHTSKSIFVTLNYILVTSFLLQISERIFVLDFWAKVILKRFMTPLSPEMAS